MNLGDPSVQRQGLNLLKPLFDDNNIAGEDMTVKTLDTEYSKALGQEMIKVVKLTILLLCRIFSLKKFTYICIK